MAERADPSDSVTAKRAAFVAALQAGSTVTAACACAGISRQTAYRWRTEDTAFAAEWEETEAQGTEELERAAMQRALTMSDTLAIFLLKARKPAMYRDTYTVQHQHSGTVDVQLLPPPQLHDVIALLQEAGALQLPPGDIIEGELIEE